jgi:acyl-ACP thioesterase
VQPVSPPLPGFAPEPAQGRTFVTSRTVRSTDVSPCGRLRLDAVARYLQEAAEDDIAEAGWAAPYGWLLRRCAITVRSYPSRGDTVRLCTFCSGTGQRWAERTTTLAGPAGDVMQARAIWVAIDRASGEPVLLGPGFGRIYGEPAQGHRVSARLSLPAPDGTSGGRDWPLRASDFDTAGHVNNTIHWAAVEEMLAAGRMPGGPAARPEPGRWLEPGWLPAFAELEYHRQILPGLLPRLVIRHEPGQVMLWLMNGGERLASARLTGAPPAEPGRPGPAGDAAS